MILFQGDWFMAVDAPAELVSSDQLRGELDVVSWLELHHGLVLRVVAAPVRGAGGVVLLTDRDQPTASDGMALTYEFLTATAPTTPAWTIHGIRFVNEGPWGRFFRVRAESDIMASVGLRASAASSGVPVLGDREHGGESWPRLALHCTGLDHAWLGQTIKAPLPLSFAAVASGSDPSYALCRDRRGEWLKSITDAFRAVHRDEIPGLPAAVDVYGPWFDAVWFDEDTDPATAQAKLAPLLDEIIAAHGCRGGTLRIHRRNPHQRSLVIETHIVGESPPARFTVYEHGLLYEISLTETQHTGLFLDQRDTRRRLGLVADGRRLVNLFAYTCSFSAVAVASGAEVAVSVDLARACLEIGKTNFALNGLSGGGRGKFVREDVRKWLARQTRRLSDNPARHLPWDLVVCDPPVFASSKEGGRFSVEKEWAGLARASAELLGPHGAAVFANNHRGGDHQRYRDQLAVVFAGVEDLAQPLDFPRLPGQPIHVRTFWCERHLSL